MMNRQEMTAAGRDSLAEISNGRMSVESAVCQIGRQSYVFAYVNQEPEVAETRAVACFFF